MITKVWSFLGDVRRLFSRTEWVIRLLRLKKYDDSSRPFGLVMVQIDGLSRKQLERAIKNGHMPFLKQLLQKEHFAVHPMYSGIPSNTPAVQAELFYGVKCATPAFSFIDRRTAQVMKMYEPACATLIESRLKEQGEPLLAGGSSYCNIFTGGALEAHFCASGMGLGAFLKSFLRAANPLVLPFLCLCYFDIFIRTSFLIAVEFFLAGLDCLRGTINGKALKKELEFIMARVVVCVLLRELLVIGGSTDVARGMPVVHLNFVGYDEQSHRRGPASAFAHWSLQGIDDSIRRVWNAAKSSRQKHYDMWVYSDHGQAKTSSYVVKHGETLEKAVKKVFGEELSNGYSWRQPQGTDEWRFEKKPARDLDASHIQVTAMGPVGHVYFPVAPTPEELSVMAEKLVREAHIPVVFLLGDGKSVRCWTPQGERLLPRDAEEILGKDHPYLEDTLADLLCLCAHLDAGHLIVMGWTAGQPAMSFPDENGAHAGLTPDETDAFALLPHDAPLAPSPRAYLRPTELREAALRFLGKDPFPHFLARRRMTAAQKTLRIMTYNVHGCVGMDGRLSTDRIARVIARHNPDIVALQELDLGRPRSRHVDQAAHIAGKMQMQHLFQSTLRDEQYGNAVFSKYPMSVMKMGPLPKLNNNEGLEPRGALWVSMDIEGMKVHFINTHLSIWPAERLLQAKALASDAWLQHPDCIGGHRILCGDFNAPPNSPTHKSLCSVMGDCQLMLEKHRPRRTYLGHYPLSRIDHVFLSAGWKIASIDVGRTELDKMASDHLPLIVELKYPDPSVI